MVKDTDQLIQKLQREKRRLERERQARKQAEGILEAKALELYHVCLLYTSPSPRDATLSRMPSSA